MSKKERIKISTLSLSNEITEWIADAAVYESSGHSGAQTLYVDRNGGAYLKIAGCGTLRRSAIIQDFFHQHKMSSPVIRYLSDDRDYLLTASVVGNDGTSDMCLAEPKKLSEAFANALRFLHEIDVTDCPLEDKLPELLDMVETAVFRQGHLDGISDYIGVADAKKSAAEVMAKRGLLKSDTFIHGDYCLPNIIFYDDWNLAGFIDLGDSGIGDCHYDLAMGLWTLYKNLKTQKYGQHFLDAYGWRRIDKDRLRICGLLIAIE